MFFIVFLLFFGSSIIATDTKSAGEWGRQGKHFLILTILHSCFGIIVEKQPKFAYWIPKFSKLNAVTD